METKTSDFLHGAQAFADELGVSLRRAYYLLESGQVRAGKLGEIWIGKRSQLHADINAQLAKGKGEPE